jgi:drug/metabolite transporter (DMT)-like permease
MVTVPFAAWLLGERVTRFQVACILAVVGGMVALS